MERILSSEQSSQAIETYGRDALKSAVDEVLQELRGGAGESPSDLDAVVRAAESRLAGQFASSLRRVINATGVLIHTNLGRSPVDSQSWSSAAGLMTGYSNLEFDLQEGARGSRQEHVSPLASALFGCEAALLVNNNAAAVLLVMAALASKREVIVSRGELVEIGGSFRIPEVIEQGGARLREVGTTNRTSAADFERAIGPDTAAMLRVHQSNFQIVGFTEEPSMAELIEVARRRAVPLAVDEGSGRVVDLARYGFKQEPVLAELIAAGVDVVTCSTDKLLGSTQGGLILGRRELVSKCARHPLMRAFRAGKESYAIVADTLRIFLSGKQNQRIPIYRMLSASVEDLRVRADRLAGNTGATTVELRSALGGGTTPAETIPSFGVAVTGSVEELQQALLRADPPVVGRVVEGRLCLDLRTVDPADDETLVRVLSSVQ